MRSERTPEERRFNAVLWGACMMGGLFMAAFLVMTLTKSSRAPHDITANWFVAWGTWAGGLATAAAFVIAAFSILVASAHARIDRQVAARIRDDGDMAQARLLVIYKVEGEQSISSLATYRIENRSRDLFFDVTVPFVDSPYGSGDEVERRTLDLVAQDNRLHEYIPTTELLTPYRDQTEHEVWFTLVTVHTSDARGIRFAVEYTDAGGRRWRQHLGGQIERVLTREAVPVREPDRFQPRQQIKRMSDIEAWRHGGSFTSHLAPLQTDEEFLEVIQTSNVMRWKRIERIGDIVTGDADGSGGAENGPTAAVTFQPSAPPFWGDHFRSKLAESGLVYAQGRSGGDGQTDVFRCPRGQIAGVVELIDAAIQHANDCFEQNELAAARRALDARRKHDW